MILTVAECLREKREGEIMRRIPIILLVLALCAGWWIRFDSLNSYCREKFGTVTQEYQIGETVEYGDDFVSRDLQHKNCSITASSVEFLNLTDFLRKYDCELWPGAEQVSDVIADITILISNASD